jgi:hypothetical protein
MGAALQLLVQPLEHIGRLHVLVMAQRQSEIAQRLLDIFFDPIAQPGERRERSRIRALEGWWRYL